MTGLDPIPRGPRRRVELWRVLEALRESRAPAKPTESRAPAKPTESRAPAKPELDKTPRVPAAE